MAVAITTKANVKESLGISGSGHDQLISDLIDRIQKRFELYCGTKFETDTFTEFHDGKGWDCLFPDNIPITSITTIHDDSEWSWGAATLIAATEYRIAHNRYVQLKTTVFSDELQNVKIVYVAGYAADAIPADLIHALTMQLQWVYTKATGNLHGMTSKNFGEGGTLAFSSGDFLPEVKSILQQYVRKAV